MPLIAESAFLRTINLSNVTLTQRTSAKSFRASAAPTLMSRTNARTLQATDQIEKDFEIEPVLFKAIPPRRQKRPRQLQNTLPSRSKQSLRVRKLKMEIHSGASNDQKPDKSSPALRSASSRTTQQHARQLETLTLEKNGRPTSPSKILCAGIWPFKLEHKETALFASFNYRKYVCIGI